ncbi:hypothetical protein E4U42_002571 [Claviceps africana]|uniref:GPI anchored serine-rich protein n=1 Tax=Claviceps africana TaxID=83212 RepID=A0A8K0JE10_9HYPO|nr:hypothetical protein E4U42_002571 [Claviceps africana]
MRFAATAAAAAVMAGTALAHNAPALSTDYTTEFITITACPETVTDCPAHKTTVTSTVRPLTTDVVYSTRVHTITACHPTVTDCPARSIHVSTETVPVTSVGPATTPGAGVPGTGVPPPAVTTQPAQCPGHAVTAITKSYTTVLTSVEYHTIDVPCPTGGSPQGTGSQPSNIPGNTTTPTVPVPTAGAASLAGSAMFAAVAGVAALILA